MRPRHPNWYLRSESHPLTREERGTPRSRRSTGTKVRVKTMFYVPAIVSELTVGLSVKDRLGTAEALRVAKLAAEHRKVETRAGRISRAVRSRLVLMMHAAQRWPRAGISKY